VQKKYETKMIIEKIMTNDTCYNAILLSCCVGNWAGLKYEHVLGIGLIGLAHYSKQASEAQNRSPKLRIDPGLFFSKEG
jgi:hypothetical protein